MANEKRLIYADDALEVLCNYCGVEGCCPDGGCAEYRKISKLPTVDAVEVVRGRWILKDSCGKNTGGLHCSVCDKIPKSLCVEDFCPDCGAKMDL